MDFEPLMIFTILLQIYPAFEKYGGQRKNLQI